MSNEKQDTGNQAGPQPQGGQPRGPNLPPQLLAGLQELDAVYLAELRLNRKEQGALQQLVSSIVRECETMHMQIQTYQRQAADQAAAGGRALVDEATKAVFPPGAK